MHDFVSLPDPGQEVDHIHGDTLDNRREKLRSCSHAENRRNQKKNANNTSGRKGVTWFKRRGKWRAQIMKDGKGHHLGLFDDLDEAAAAYDAAAEELFGEFARTNERVS